MTDSNESVTSHYGVHNLLEAIFAGLVAEGKDPFRLTVDDLASVDQFHTRGRTSTIEMAKLAKPKASDRVLDVGCGIGGSARWLAREFGCQVTGIDLTEDYILAASKLTQLVKLNQRVDFQVASALQLPVEDQSIDLVWTEHASMNIQNKPGFYREIARVLKPNGRFVFHDVFAAKVAAQLEFPVPWASHSGISFLDTLENARQLIQDSGLRTETIVEKTDLAEAAFRKAVEQMKSGQHGATGGLGLQLLMGANIRTKTANYLAGLSRGSLTVAMGLAIRE